MSEREMIVRVVIAILIAAIGSGWIGWQIGNFRYMRFRVRVEALVIALRNQARPNDDSKLKYTVAALEDILNGNDGLWRQRGSPEVR